MKQHRIPYPFYRGERDLYDAATDTNVRCKTWECGPEYENSGSDGGGVDAYAHGIGLMVLTEISRHKPATYPERVFFTRHFFDPEGKRFGKGGLRVATSKKFERLCGGYKCHSDSGTYDTGEKTVMLHAAPTENKPQGEAKLND